MATTRACTEEKNADYYEQRVELMVPRDASNPKEESASITVNGKTWLIKRGETVQVPRFVYLAYMDSEKQKAKAYGLEQQAVDKNM